MSQRNYAFTPKKGFDLHTSQSEVVFNNIILEEFQFGYIKTHYPVLRHFSCLFV